MIVWLKPSEIPYQAKVANCVNLIGCVKAPIQFHTASDGKHFAATVISQEISGGKDSLLIPVSFEGDLAHVVAFHVKENDCVLVSGQLSSEPMHFKLSDSVGKFHVVGENLNFVEGFKRGVSRKKSEGSVSGLGIENPADGGIGNVVDEEFDQRWKAALEDAKVKKLSVEEDWGSSSARMESNGGSDGAMLRFGEAKPVIGESAMKKKDGDRSLDLWRDLVKNSLLWWDYRDHKEKGMVKEKFPDFKHKETGDALWVDSAPKWVVEGLGKLEFDVQVIKPKLVQGGEGCGVRTNNGNDEDSWKDLVESPLKWWDNRTSKRNPKAPDFRHKETGKGLWVSSSPDWALSRLPQLK